MYDITVLMSTYNGEKYIREQLDSILGQKKVKPMIFIRDDGSTDQTWKIIAEYEEKYENIRFINKNSVKNIGFNESFLHLIDYGLAHSDTDWFAFADQDDVWLTDKLCNACESVLKYNNENAEKPVIYFACKKWVNEKLEFMHEDDMHYCKGNYFDMFMLPPFYGCTCVFNRKLAKMTLQVKMPKEFFYEVYMYRLVCMVNGVLIVDKRPCMLYRRHGKNTSVDTMKFSPLLHLKKKIFNKTNYHGIQKYVDFISQNFEDELGCEQKKLAGLISDYDVCFAHRIKLLLWQKAYEYGIKASIMWIGRIILNSI